MKKQATQLSAPACCFELVANFRAHPCTNKAQPNGYCTQHQYAAHLLDTARFYGCPELLPVRKNEKTKELEGLIIRQGYHNWQAYCCVVLPTNAERIGKQLDSEHGKLFKRGVA